MPCWPIIVYGHLNSQRDVSTNNGLVILAPTRACQTKYLPREESYWSVWNRAFCPQFFVSKESFHFPGVIQSWNWAEILNLDRVTHLICLGSRFRGPATPNTVPIKHDLYLVYANVWSIGQVSGVFADYVGFPRGRQLLMDDARIDYQSEQSGASDSDSPHRYSVEPSRSIYLVLAIVFFLGILFYIVGMRLNFYGINHSIFSLWMLGWWLGVLGVALVSGLIAMFLAHLILRFWDNTVTQKYPLTTPNYCNTLIVIGRAQMANILSTDKQIAVIGALAEGSSIRSIERITGVHRDTIMRLGVRAGKGCAKLLDAKMRDLSCQHLQFDEIWGFVGKKERHCTPDDSLEFGDVWTFCAIDSDTKLVPSFKVGKRDSATANAFVADVAGRIKNRVQISSDALRAYVEAVEGAFGANVDFAQIVKTYVNDGARNAERKYSAAEFVIEEKKAISGFPDMRLASTSHVERLNGTTRLHMRRLTRLTYAFSKKLENFEAAVALHFAYYNFVKRHNTLRATPAMAAGIERDFWTVGNLVEATV
jgi:IS1 family transposase